MPRPRTRRCILALLAAALLTNCMFDRPADVGEEDASSEDHDGNVGGPDAPVDAETCAAGTTTCDDAIGRYVECSAAGAIEFEMNCPLGCDSTLEKCVDVEASNGVSPYLDQARTDPSVVDVVITGTATVNTATGEVLQGATPIAMPSVAFDGSRVFMAKSLTVSGTLKVIGSDTGSPPRPVFVVDGDVSISGLIDVSADLATNGPGSRLSSDTCAGGYVLGGTSPSAGAGGAGRVNSGGRGGNAGNGESGGAGGAILLDPDTLVPLRGGCPGGFVLEDPNSVTSKGGGGGGAIQIVSRTRIAATSTGRIDASGGGGLAGPIASGTIGGGGGGAGGSILLEAPVIVLDGNGVVLTTKGGSGAAAGSSAAHNGLDGGFDITRAPGGTNAGQASGGSGGIFGNGPADGINGSGSTADAGGGGGSVGQARFNTLDGTLTPMNGAAIRARQSTGVLATRLVP